MSDHAITFVWSHCLHQFMFLTSQFDEGDSFNTFINSNLVIQKIMLTKKKLCMRLLYNELQDKIGDLDEDMFEVVNRVDIQDKCCVIF